MSDEDIKFEDVITDLEQNRAKARKEADEAARMKRELTDLRKQIENDRIKLKENKSRILDDGKYYQSNDKTDNNYNKRVFNTAHFVFFSLFSFHN